MSFKLHVGEASLNYDDSNHSAPFPKDTFLCLPGIGDLRFSYRFLSPLLQARGKRTVQLDLRGIDDTNFDSFTPESSAKDVAQWVQENIQSIDRLFLVGNSLAAGSVALATIDESIAKGKLKGLIWLGPIVRDAPFDKYFRAICPLLFKPFWGASMWIAYWKGLTVSHKPADFEEYTKKLHSQLKGKGRMSALVSFVKAPKTNVEASLPKLNIPVLSFYGEKDQDYPNVDNEVEWIKSVLGEKIKIVKLAGVGHYPQVEKPEDVANEICSFVDAL